MGSVPEETGVVSVIIEPQKGPQSSLISCPCDEICYGGARGGGKSFGILIDWLSHEAKYKKLARGIVFRKTYKDLSDLIETAKDMFPLFGASWNKTDKQWTFPSGAIFFMSYLKYDKDADNYQGHNYNWMGFDEAGGWSSPKPLDKLNACLRSAGGVKSRLILTCNPGGVGHNWIKRRFIDPAPPMKVQHLEGGGTRVFIPAKVSDNKLLLENDPTYIQRIKRSGPDWLVKAWLNGDWDIVAGGALDDKWDRKRHVLPHFQIPASWRVDRGFDWGSAKPFSVLWFAESDGTECIIDGKTRSFPRGSIIIVREWYGAKKDTEEGLNLGAAEIARGIKERELGFEFTVYDGPADNSIHDVSNGNCIATDMEDEGISWEKSNKGPGSRMAGLNKIRTMMGEAVKDYPESPGLWIMEDCTSVISHLPILARDDKNIEDIDTNQPDHDYDVIRYRTLKLNKIATLKKPHNGR